MANNGVITAVITTEPTGVPNAGEVYIWVDVASGRWKQKDELANVSDYLFEAPDSANPYGTNYIEDSIQSYTRTGGDGYGNALTLNLDNLLAGRRYCVKFLAWISIANTSSRGRIRVSDSIDGVVQEEFDYRFRQAGIAMPFPMEYHFTANEESRVVTFEVDCKDDFTSVTVERVKGESWRLY